MECFDFSRFYRFGFIKVFACDRFCKITLFNLISFVIDPV